MMLTDLVPPTGVAIDVAVAGKAAALDRASALLAATTGVPADRIAAALAAREALGTTGFGGGLAIPHGRVAENVPISAVILRLAHAVDWDAMDGTPVDLLFVLLGPDAGSAEYLKALARLSRVGRDRALLAKLRGARTAAALWALILGMDERAAA